MFISYNGLAQVREPYRTRLIQIITETEIQELKYRRFQRRYNRVSWLILVVMGLDGLSAAWHLVFAHLDGFFVGLNVCTLMLAVYLVPTNARNIAKYRRYRAQNDAALHRWDDLIAWDTIPAKLRKGRPHGDAQSPQRVAQPR